MSADVSFPVRANLTRCLPYLVILVSGIGLYTPFASRFLYHTDSVGFALAIHNFDILKHQPGGPGYPLYVLALRAVQFVTGSTDNACIVTVSVLATIVSIILLYVLALTWMSRLEALITSLVVMTSPVVWFNAEVAMSYPVGMLGSVAVALSCLRFIDGSVSARYLLPVVWGLSAGFRPDVGVMLLPLVIYTCRYEILSGRRYAPLMSVAAVVTVAAWLVPVIWITGGPLQYFGRVHSAAAAISPLTFFREGDISSGIGLMLKNIAVAVMFLGVGALGLLPAQATRLSKEMVRQRTDRVRAEHVTFLCVWFLPGFILDALTSVGHSGYILPYLPPFLMLLLTPFDKGRPYLEGRSGLSFQPRTAFLGVGIALQSVFFLLAPQREGTLSGNWVSDTLLRTAALEPTLSRIKRYDATIEGLVAEIKLSYPPDVTILLVPVGDELPRNRPIRHLYGQGRYYLPEWEQRVLYTIPLAIFKRIGWQGNAIASVHKDEFKLANTNIVAIPQHVRWLVWLFDADSSPYPFDAAWIRYSVGSGVHMVIGDMRAAQPRRWGPFEFKRSVND